MPLQQSEIVARERESASKREHNFPEHKKTAEWLALAAAAALPAVSFHNAGNAAPAFGFCRSFVPRRLPKFQKEIKLSASAGELSHGRGREGEQEPESQRERRQS